MRRLLIPVFALGAGGVVALSSVIHGTSDSSSNPDKMPLKASEVVTNEYTGEESLVFTPGGKLHAERAPVVVRWDRNRHLGIDVGQSGQSLTAVSLTAAGEHQPVATTPDFQPPSPGSSTFYAPYANLNLRDGHAVKLKFSVMLGNGNTYNVVGFIDSKGLGSNNAPRTFVGNKGATR